LPREALARIGSCIEFGDHLGDDCLDAFSSPVWLEGLARFKEGNGRVKKKKKDRMDWSKKSEYYQEVRENRCSI